MSEEVSAEVETPVEEVSEEVIEETPENLETPEPEAPVKHKVVVDGEELEVSLEDLVAGFQLLLGGK